jgi:hypothetical protein
MPPDQSDSFTVVRDFLKGRAERIDRTWVVLVPHQPLNWDSPLLGVATFSGVIPYAARRIHIENFKPVGRGLADGDHADTVCIQNDYIAGFDSLHVSRVIKPAFLRRTLPACPRSSETARMHLLFDATATGTGAAVGIASENLTGVLERGIKLRTAVRTGSRGIGHAARLLHGSPLRPNNKVHLPPPAERPDAALSR